MGDSLPGRYVATVTHLAAGCRGRPPLSTTCSVDRLNLPRPAPGCLTTHLRCHLPLESRVKGRPVNDVEVLDQYIESTVGTEIAQWPGGWPGQIEAALIDAIYSIRARYGGPKTGVRAVVNNWRERDGHTGRADDLEALAGMSPEEFVKIVKNSSQASGRLKGEIVIDAARALSKAGLRHSGDLTDAPEQKRAYLSVKGCGPVTWYYFRMLLGRPDIKPDTWILRFVKEALGRTVSPEEARTLLTAVAAERGVSASELDNVVWNFARGTKR